MSEPDGAKCLCVHTAPTHIVAARITVRRFSPAWWHLVFAREPRIDVALWPAKEEAL